MRQFFFFQLRPRQRLPGAVHPPLTDERVEHPDDQVQEPARRVHQHAVPVVAQEHGSDARAKGEVRAEAGGGVGKGAERERAGDGGGGGGGVGVAQGVVEGEDLEVDGEGDEEDGAGLCVWGVLIRTV